MPPLQFPRARYRIENESCVDGAGNDEIKTTVRLVGFKDKYRAQCPKRLETIAAFIVEEFLEYFIGPAPPVVTLRDHATGEAILLEQFFEQQMASKISPEKFTVDDKRFELLHVRLYSSHISEHKLYLCAHGRVVVPEKLVGKIPNLVRHLVDDDGHEFTYAAYANSEVLDAAVNPDRTAFNLPETDDGLLPLFETTLSQVLLRPIPTSRSSRRG